MGDSANGKPCEGKQNRVNVQLVGRHDELLRLSSKPELEGSEIIDDNMASVTLNPTNGNTFIR